MKIKPIYIINFIFIIIIIALLFTPLRSILEKYQSNTAKTVKIEALDSEQFNIELKGINTPDINFKDLKGKKIFLNFWGTWCPACIQEMPSIQQYYNKEKENIQFVLIYIKDEKSKVIDYLQKNNYNFPVYEAISPIDKSLLPQLFPTTYLINEQGKVLEKIEGAKDWADFQFR